MQGEVKLVDEQFYYYLLIPISNALSGLSLERMKQQAEVCGIIWDKTDELSFPDYEEPDNLAFLLWDDLKLLPLGEVSIKHWSNKEDILLKEYVHRPHDALINPGYGTAYEKVVNAVTRDSHNKLQRLVFSND